MLGKILLGLGAGLAALALALSGRERKSLPIEPGPEPKRRQKAARRLSLLEPSTRAFAVAIIDWARAQGIPAYLGMTYRSPEEQQKVDPRRTAIKEGEVGWHSVGRSFHLDIRKTDNTFDKAAYAIVGAEVRRRGGVWLGDRERTSRVGTPFLDLAHFEYHPGFKNLSQYRGTPLARQELVAAERRVTETAAYA